MFGVLDLIVSKSEFLVGISRIDMRRNGKPIFRECAKQNISELVFPRGSINSDNSFEFFYYCNRTNRNSLAWHMVWRFHMSYPRVQSRINLLRSINYVFVSALVSHCHYSFELTSDAFV